jgi:hypothetical protein
LLSKPWWGKEIPVRLSPKGLPLQRTRDCRWNSPVALSSAEKKNPFSWTAFQAFWVFAFVSSPPSVEGGEKVVGPEAPGFWKPQRRAAVRPVFEPGKG